MKSSRAHYSLRSRLVAWISIPVILVALLAVVSSYYFARHEIEEVYDAQLVHSAKVLLQLTEHEIMQDEGFYLGLENPDLQHRYERKLGFRIWAKDGLITQSPSSKSFGDFEAGPGFSNHFIDGNEWRFYVFLEPVNKIKIEVSERYDIRYELIIQLMASLIVPALMFLPVILLIIWMGIRQVLKPVVEISEDVDARSSDDLSQIRKKSLPLEIAPLITALNRLLERMEQSFRREREFTDHAAHELRTPLAAMKTQTQVLVKKAREIPEFSEGLENLQSSIDRATHLVEQLLALARLQHEALPQEKLDLADILQSRLPEAAQRAKSKHITFKAVIAENCIINGHADSLHILLGNLIDNALKYTPDNGTVSILLTSDGMLEIADTGPGLSDEDKLRVFERFVRADKSGQSGSGLGLSIAQWIAKAHKVGIRLLDNRPQGLKVQIKWETV